MGTMPQFENPCGAYSRYEITKHITLDRLAALVDAERDGRCKILPCKVGDTVYYIPQYGGKSYCGVQVGHAQHITVSKINWRIQVREHHPHNMDFVLGKTVFLTRAEAEAKGGQE